MKIPKHIKILFKNYRVKEEENLHNSDHDLAGEIDYLNHVIRLNANVKEEEKKVVLLHEVMHGIDDMFSVNLTEEQVESLALGFYLLIKENKELFEE